MSGGPALSREQILDEVGELAAVEHSLCVEYLTVHCALGHDFRTEPPTPTSERVDDAARAAFGRALREMRHLHELNGVLTGAGRSPELGRAASVDGASTPAIMLGSPSAADLERLLERERAIATAVDGRYARLRSAVAGAATVLGDELHGRLSFVLDSGPDHSFEQLDELLESLSPSEYLRATRRDPSNDLEERLLELSDRQYVALVRIVEVWFGHEDQLGGELFGRALELMGVLNDINRLLVKQGLVPAFTPP